jgi:hypothetical protein
VNAPLACPHCKSVLPPNPPGVFHCGRCGKPFTVPGPQDLARLEKKRQDEKLVIMIVGAVVFLFYVGPILLAFGYMCFVMVIYVLMAIGMGIGAAAG